MAFRSDTPRRISRTIDPPIVSWVFRVRDPLHYLILLRQPELLRRLYEKVVIPDAVAGGLRVAGAPREVRDWMSDTPSWLAVVTVSDEEMAQVSDELDLGERAAIAIAQRTRADLLLIDETAGRAEARRRSLRVTGTLGVLRAGAEAGLARTDARPPHELSSTQ